MYLDTQMIFYRCLFLKVTSLCIYQNVLFFFALGPCTVLQDGGRLTRTSLLWWTLSATLTSIHPPAGFFFLYTLFWCSMIATGGPLVWGRHVKVWMEPFFNLEILCNGCTMSWSSKSYCIRTKKKKMSKKKCARESYTWVRIQLCVFPMEKVKGCI